MLGTISNVDIGLDELTQVLQLSSIQMQRTRDVTVVLLLEVRKYFNVERLKGEVSDLYTLSNCPR